MNSPHFQTQLAQAMHVVDARRQALEHAARMCSQTLGNESITLRDRIAAANALARLEAQMARLPIGPIAPHTLSHNPHNRLEEPEEILPTAEQLEECVLQEMEQNRQRKERARLKLAEKAAAQTLQNAPETQPVKRLLFEAPAAQSPTQNQPPTAPSTDEYIYSDQYSTLSNWPR